MIVVTAMFRDDVGDAVQSWPDGQEHVAASWARTMKARPDVLRVDVAADCIVPNCPWCADSQSETCRSGAGTSLPA